MNNKIETARTQKDTPKKPESCGNGYYACPTCKVTLPMTAVSHKIRWCSVCEQALDWEDVR